MSKSQAVPARFQIHLRVHRPDPETERRVRKHIAWLDIEKPFGQPVREMQRMLVRRLLQHGWIADEYLVLGTRESLHGWVDSIHTHFKETTERMGFPKSPIETGDFIDFLATGYHSRRGTDSHAELPD